MILSLCEWSVCKFCNWIDIMQSFFLNQILYCNPLFLPQEFSCFLATLHFAVDNSLWDDWILFTFSGWWAKIVAIILIWSLSRPVRPDLICYSWTLRFETSRRFARPYCISPLRSQYASCRFAQSSVIPFSALGFSLSQPWVDSSIQNWMRSRSSDAAFGILGLNQYFSKRDFNFEMKALV